MSPADNYRPRDRSHPVTSGHGPPGDDSEHGDGHLLTATCPLACMAGHLSLQAFDPLRHDLPYLLGRPPTISDVTAWYLHRHLRHIRNLGPRRIGEIGLVLILAGLIAPPSDLPSTTRAPPCG